MRILIPRPNEIIQTTSNVEEAQGKFLAEHLYNKWIEDYIDEATGELSPMERKEIVLQKGTLIDGLSLGKIIQVMEENQYNEIKVSNVSRLGIEDFGELTIWVATAEINKKKKNFYMYSTSAQNTIKIVSDYIEQTYNSLYNIVSVKKMKNSRIVSESENYREEDSKWYNITLKLRLQGSEDTFENEFIVMAKNAEEAKEYSEKFFHSELNTNSDNYEITLISAKKINAEAVIDYEFSYAYIDNGEQ